MKARNKEAFKDVIWATFDSTTTPTPAHLLKRGNYETPGHVVPPGVIAVGGPPDRTARFDQAPGDWTDGRRLALARWLTHPEHPLVARVMVNRIWQYHFGTGLVSTPEDFGARGSRPISQELLDWLAAEFVEKRLECEAYPPAHPQFRNLSPGYRESPWFSSSSFLLVLVLEGNCAPGRRRGCARPASPIAAFNPGPRRLEAGAIRDAMIEVSGRLDRRLFGPSVPTERRADGSFDLKQGHADRLRRTVYVHTRRTYVPTFLTCFDEPQMDTNWPKRSSSAIAQQALAQMNEPFMIECAGAFAARVMAEGGNTFAGRLWRAFELAYQRAPSAEEVACFSKPPPASRTRGRPSARPCSARASSSMLIRERHETLP